MTPPTTTADEYVPSWARDNGEIPETPRSEQYGSGVGFHDADQTSDDEATDEADDGTDDNTDETDGVEYTKPDPETPSWVDDTVAVTREDVTPSCGHPLSDRAIPDVDEARAHYRLPDFPHESAYYQLLDRHDLKFAGERTETVVNDTTTHKELFATRDGLKIQSKDYRNEDGRLPVVSYLWVEGPTEDVADFVIDLLDAAYSIKAEFRPPAETTDVERNGNSVDNDTLDRIVGREHIVGVVADVREDRS